MPVVGDGHDTRALERADGREFIARDALRDGAGDIHIHHRVARRLLAHEGDLAGVVNRGRRVRHAHDAGEAAARRRPRAGGERLLRGLAWLAKMDVQINQAGTNHLAPRVQLLGDEAGGDSLASVRAHDGDFAVQHQHIGQRVEMVRGVNHTTADDEKRFHAPRRLAGSELTGQARSVESQRIAGVAQW